MQNFTLCTTLCGSVLRSGQSHLAEWPDSLHKAVNNNDGDSTNAIDDGNDDEFLRNVGLQCKIFSESVHYYSFL